MSEVTRKPKDNHRLLPLSITRERGKTTDIKIIEFRRIPFMSAPIQLLPGALAELFAQVSCSGVLTLADRYGLMAAVFDDTLTDEERFALNRLLRSASRGQVQLVNELSVLV